jgi:hypothetical protein
MRLQIMMLSNRCTNRCTSFLSKKSENCCRIAVELQREQSKQGGRRRVYCSDFPWQAIEGMYCTPWMSADTRQWISIIKIGTKKTYVSVILNCSRRKLSAALVGKVSYPHTRLPPPSKANFPLMLINGKEIKNSSWARCLEGGGEG